MNEEQEQQQQGQQQQGQQQGQQPAPPTGGGGGEQADLNIDPKLAGLLCYLFSPIAGIIIFVMEKKNRFMRFHAMQSIWFGGAVVVISIALTIVIGILSAISGGLACVLNILLPIWWLLVLVVTIMMMIKAYQGEMYKLPIIGDQAEKYI